MQSLFFTNVAYASVDSLISKVNQHIINPIIVLLFALALAYFLYGVFEFISNAQDSEKRTTGRNHMMWGVVGIVIMLGVRTILKIVEATLNF